jgi:hypothetical protein
MDRIRDTEHGAQAVALVRKLAASGEAWDAITFRDDLEALIDAHAAAGAPRGRLIRECERAYAEGRREHLRATWATRWTTAPSDYDTFGTETIAECGTWCGKPLRQVVIDPQYVGYQEARYGSGLHGSWSEDPNVETARLQAESEARRVEQAAHEAKHAEGLAWLAGLSETELLQVDAGQHDGELDAFGIGWSAVRAEIKKRREAKADRDRAEAWSKYRPMIPADCVLVDDGCEGGYSTGEYPFRIPRRDARVYYGVSVVEIDQDAERSIVESAGWRHGEPRLGSLSDVAYQLGNGRLRVAAPSEVPPKKVLDRFGHDRLKEIKRLEIAGRVVWVGRVRFSYEIMILDENGRIVRAKAVVSEALKATS